MVLTTKLLFVSLVNVQSLSWLNQINQIQIKSNQIKFIRIDSMNSEHNVHVWIQSLTVYIS